MSRLKRFGLLLVIINANFTVFRTYIVIPKRSGPPTNIPFHKLYIFLCVFVLCLCACPFWKYE